LAELQWIVFEPALALPSLPPPLPWANAMTGAATNPAAITAVRRFIERM
jgi:hypothetical protein